MCSSNARAQRTERTLDIGALAIQYADTLSGVAATLTPHLFADWGNRLADLSATYSQFGSNWSLQGQASGSLFAPVGPLLGELAGFAGGSTHRDGSRTGELLLNARLHAQTRIAELFTGVGVGSTSFGGETNALFLAEAGISRAIPEGEVTFTITPVAVGDSIRYTDGQLSIGWQRPTLDFNVIAGARVGDQLTSLGGTARAWGNISAAFWVTSRAAVTVSGGSYPIDPTQGFPGGRFISLGMRITHRGRTPTIAPDSAQVTDSAATKFVLDYAAGTATFRVFAPLAHNVELAADFTGWEPVALAPAGEGWWVATRPLGLGKYQINLRVNGGKWVVPPGLLSMVDEFGGNVGLLVIE